MCKVEGHLLTSRQPDQINTLFVMCIVIRPIGGDDNALTFCVCASTSWVRYIRQRAFVNEIKKVKKKRKKKRMFWCNLVIGYYKDVEKYSKMLSLH